MHLSLNHSLERPHLNPLPRGEEDAKRQVRGRASCCAIYELVSK